MPDADLSLILAAAQDAGKIALRHFRADPQAWDKPDNAGPVTEADLEVDRFLQTRLMAARPGYGWLSEETEDDHARLTAEHVFIVDPIDGTRAFISGAETWAVVIAIARAGVITDAVVHLPARGLTYAARLGAGAQCNGAALRCATHAKADGAHILAAKPTLAAAHWPGGLPALTRSFRPALAYRLALVAEGRFDAMITLRPSWEWDIAAGALIVTEAGGAVSDRHGRALRFNSGEARLDGVVAGGACHAALVARLTQG